MTPLVGFSPGVGPVHGLIIGAVVLVANIVTLLGFQRSSHRWRAPAMAVHVGVIGLLVVLGPIDGVALIG